MADSTASTIAFTPPTSVCGTTSPPAASGPYTGGIFHIIQRGTDMILTLLNGELILTEGNDPQGNNHWVCTDHGGHMGFRNSASGTFVGHDGKKGGFMVGNATQRRLFERMAVNAVEEGGFKIMAEWWFGFQNVGISADGRRLVRTFGEPAAWEFVRVPGREKRGWK